MKAIRLHHYLNTSNAFLLTAEDRKKHENKIHFNKHVSRYNAKVYVMEKYAVYMKQFIYSFKFIYWHAGSSSLNINETRSFENVYFTSLEYTIYIKMLSVSTLWMQWDFTIDLVRSNMWKRLKDYFRSNEINQCFINVKAHICIK